MKAGIKKRIGAKLPSPDRNTLRRFKRFVWNWCRKNLKPLDPDVDLSFETWLSQTNYTETRKAELRRKHYSGVNVFDPKYTSLKCFMKDETYVDYKHVRGIFSRTDEFKCVFGPYVKAIENVVYKCPQFIKHVPVSERPDYILNYLYRPDACYSATDYTAFESSFVPDLMKATSFILYEYMFKNVPAYVELMKCLKVISGENHCYFKHLKMKILATRMSGEMDTSLANGFSNLMTYLFLMYEKGVDPDDVKIVVEGDDGLASTPNNIFPTKEDFATLGYNIKIEIHDSIETASFCGMIFDRIDRINVTNPLEVLYTMGWLPNRYKGACYSTKCAILRCKALSAAHQYPSCPIIWSFSQYILRHTRQFHGAARDMLSKNVFNTYERQGYIDAFKFHEEQRALKQEERVPVKVCSERTRQLMEYKYSISINDQLSFESFCDQRKVFEPFRPDCLEKYVPESWFDYYFSYGRVPDGDVNHPSLGVIVQPNLKVYTDANGKVIATGPDADGD